MTHMFLRSVKINAEGLAKCQKNMKKQRYPVGNELKRALSPPLSATAVVTVVHKHNSHTPNSHGFYCSRIQTSEEESCGYLHCL